MASSNKIFKDALNLSLLERAALIDQLLFSLEKSGNELDELWNKVAKDRINAFERGEVRALNIKKDLEEYRWRGV